MKNLILVCLSITFMITCQPPTTSSVTPKNKNMMSIAPFIHTVFFYFNDGVSDEQKKAFVSGMKKLGTCSMIVNFRIGQPAMTPREIVDNNYDYSWMVEFENSTDQDAYQTDPIHLEFIESFQQLWKDVKVYDSIMID